MMVTLWQWAAPHGGMALFPNHGRRLLSLPENLRRMNLVSGVLLILAGGVIALT